MGQGKQITNRYVLLDKLGKGGMGTVWRAYDRLEKTDVALKQVLLPETKLGFASKAGPDDTDKLRLSLAHEFSLLATLRHPHILSVLDFSFDENRHPFFTMTLLEGGQDVKTYATKLTLRRRIKLTGQMLQALHYLHRRGIVHRDLKPANVFVTTDEQIKVMDFGIAKLDKGQSSQADTLAGTISYMAPELLRGESASVGSDLFAVGVMIYEIMVGHHPFAAESVPECVIKIMTVVPPMTPIPVEFVPWLKKILEKDPANRFATAYDALIAFYDVIGVAAPAEDRAIRESFLQASKFVGRDAELKQLTDALGTIDTKNALFLIGGESGVGKSRLLDELRVRALVSGADVLRGQGVEGGGLPFQLWRNIVRRLLLMLEVTDLQAGILKDIVPDIDELLQRDIANAPELTDKAHQDRMILNIVDLFRNVARPVVLLLEDLQWTGESLAVLQQMVKISEQLPKLMVVATYRDDEAPDLPQKLTGMTHIKLERLDTDAAIQLSSAMLGDVGRNEKVVQLLYSQSEGNLFFLVETVRALAEASGDLQRIGQGELPGSVFTGGMQAITRRRLSKVDAQYVDIQTLAAICGREIDVKLLAHIHDEATVQAWLTNASEYGVVSIQDNRWRFAHDKLREAITADIPRETVPTIHRTAATTIETVYPDDDAYNEALFAHWQAAGDLDKTCQYLLPVARNMIEIAGTYPIAEAHLHQTLERLPKNDARCITLWNWLADSAERQNNLSASQGYALQAQELAASLDDRKGLATSLSNLGNIAMDQGEYARATDLYQQSLVIFQQLGDQLGIASSLSNLGIIAVSQGEYVRAIDRHQQSLAIRQQLGDQAGIAVSLCNLGIAAANQGEYVRATDLFQQSLVIFQQLGNQPSIASLVNNLGVVAANQWEYARATDLYQQSLAIRQQLGDQAGIAVSLINLGVSARSQGEVARATDLFQQSIVIFQQLGDQAGIAECLNELGAIARSQGEVARATDLFQQSLVIAYDIQAIRTILASIVGLAKHFFIQGHLERAAHYAGLAQSHPAKSNDVRQALAELLPQLESALTPDEFQTALERGKSLDLNTVVEELLAEFAEYSGGQGQVESAAHSTDFAQHHPPKDDNDVRDALAEVVPSLEVTLSPDERAADLESDMPLDLDTVVLEAALSPDKRAAALERDKELDLDTVVSDTVVQELLDESTPPEA